MEITEKYKVYNEDVICVQWSDEVESLLNIAEKHLIKAYWHFMAKEVSMGSDKEFFQNNYMALAIYHMLLEVGTAVAFYRDECNNTCIELRRIGAFITRLTIIENAVEDYYRELNVLNINSEKVLSDLHQAISELQHFLWEHISPIKQ